MAENASPRRRWSPFGIKTCLVLAVLVVVAGWFTLRLVRASKQRAAVTALNRVGGRAFYNCQYTESGRLKKTGVPGPRWLRSLLGADFCAEVNGVLLSEAGDLEGLANLSIFSRPLGDLSDRDFVNLKVLTGLDWLAVSGTPFGDAGLENIKGLSNLERLWLCSTGLTDAGMGHLENLQGLEGLWLDDNLITDAGLRHLARLSRLEVLSLSRTRISDAGLIHLSGMGKLRVLRLDGTRCTFSGVVRLYTELQNRPLTDALEAVAQPKLDDGEVLALDLSRIQTTDAGLAHLVGLVRLEWLFLNGGDVTDDGLVHLEGLKNLTLLDLSGTQVTDAGLEHLQGLSKLRTLHLGGTQVTDDGIRKLEQSLPRSRVYRAPLVQKR